MSLKDTFLPQTEIDLEQLEKLVQLALSLGASDARIITSNAIKVKDSLASLCIKPRCSNYGLSASCPPHVSGPAGFRKLQQTLPHALAVRIVVPSSMLLSSESKELARYLYELVAALEQEAVGMEYTDSIAFAGGSCKRLFCYDQPDCQKISKGECRHPQIARASMSGYGVDVFELMKTCGWEVNLNTNRSQSQTEDMSWIAGLIMIG
ncbi:MAG: DUF2284 domain-containing protein [Anaerolineales bacterium]|nr:DUF2284 domain-containing protein [Anaerolineales bacterium]